MVDGEEKYLGPFKKTRIERRQIAEMVHPVLDNASVLHAPALRAFAEAAECMLMLLPAYLPELNPVKHIWATLKKRVPLSLVRASLLCPLSQTCLAEKSS